MVCGYYYLLDIQHIVYKMKELKIYTCSYMLASSDYYRLSHYLNLVIGELHNPIITLPQVSVPLVSQLMACYGKGGTAPLLESGVWVYELYYLNTNTHIDIINIPSVTS